MAKEPVIVSTRPNAQDALGDRRRSLYAWQDRIRDPSLTVLLVLELAAIFLAAPLAAKGLPVARAIADTLMPAFRSALYPLDRSQDVFNWEPL